MPDNYREPMSAKSGSKTGRRRAPLTPMRVSDGFRAFVLDQLSDVTDLRPKSMFGGVGLYSGDVFFGIVAADVLYLKVDDTNRRTFERAGAKPFKPYADRPTTTMSYFSVTVAIVEDAEVLVDWARRSIAVARAAQSSKSPQDRKPRPPR